MQGARLFALQVQHFTVRPLGARQVTYTMQRQSLLQALPHPVSLAHGVAE
jgi:hypothetical protein